MKQRNLYFGLLLLSLPFLQGVQCNKSGGYQPLQPEHQFQETVSLSPYQLTYHVGDTLWLRLNIPDKKLLDEKTGTRVLFDSMLFSNTAAVQLLYNDPYLGDGPFAKFIFPTGVAAYTNTYNYLTAASVSFGCAPSRDYSLLLGIVLLQKGVFGFSFNNSGLQSCSTNSYNYSTLTFSFDVTDTHKEYYLQLPLDAIGKKPDDNVLLLLEKKQMVALQVL